MMKYKIVLQHSEEGYSVSCPAAGRREKQKRKRCKTSALRFKSTWKPLHRPMSFDFQILCLFPKRVIQKESF